MRIPCRHRFHTPADSDELFRRLPVGARFRFAPADEPEVFGTDPVRTLSRFEAGDDPCAWIAGGLRDRLPRTPYVDRPGPFRFPGGAVGVIDYESGHEREGLPPRFPSEPPTTWFGVYDTFAVHDATRGEVEVVSWGLGPDGSFDADEALHRATELEEMLRQKSPERPAGVSGPGRLIRASLTPDRHAASLERILDHIRAGDIYQANLTARFDVGTELPAPDLFERLRRANPSPYAAFLETGDATIVSCSPERLLRVRGRDLSTRPIKGTAARHVDPVEDTRRARELLASDKDQAELLMITDLLRNDLGKVGVPGSVRVPHLRQLESFPHLHHLVSTVRARLRPGYDAIDALAAVFPGGSITGAPKRRAMEILAELETAPRGAYTGTVGWVGFDGTADFSVAIRTSTHADGIFSFGAGGGIVVDSEPAAEWRELLLKARAFALALDVNLETLPQVSA